MSDSLYADLLRSNVVELRTLAKRLHPRAWVALECTAAGWELYLTISDGDVRTFKGNDPGPLFRQATMFLQNLTPAEVA